jgi:hypothetical protein
MIGKGIQPLLGLHRYLDTMRLYQLGTWTAENSLLAVAVASAYASSTSLAAWQASLITRDHVSDDVHAVA